MVQRRVSCRLFGRHVGRSSERGTDLGQRGWSEIPPSAYAQRRLAAVLGTIAAGGGSNRLRNSEVRDHRVRARQQHVVGLEIAMDDAARMCIVERVGDLAQESHCLRYFEPPLPPEPA